MANYEDAEPGLPQSRVVEVVFPSDEPHHWLALNGLAAAFGWRLRDTAERGTISAISAAEGSSHVPEDIPITAAGTKAVSVELFGAENYGETACSILRNAGWPYRNLIIITEGDSVRFDTPYTQLLPTLSRYIAPAGTPYAEIEALARERLAMTKPPFVCEFQPITLSDRERSFYYPGSTGQIIRVVPGDVTKHRLAAYLRSRHYHLHELHGLLGKAFDILNVVAESASPRVLPEFDAGDFISVAELMHQAKAWGVPASGVDVIRHRLKYGHYAARWSQASR